MTIPSVSYGLYAPTELFCISLGVGISLDTNSNLNLVNEQSLIVAERVQSISNAPDRYTYGLIVDNQGLAINTTRSKRAELKNTYAAYIDGDVRVTGNIVVDGHLLGQNVGFGGASGSGSSSVGTSNYWIMCKDDNNYTNIYYNGTITLGNNTAATSNQYTINVVTPAEGNVEHLQLSLQNLQSAQLRVGVVGDAANAPIVFSTNAISNMDGELGGAIEFHIGRDQSYFSQIYNSDAPDAPDYSTFGVSMAPHMRLDETGNVGIHTSQNRVMNFNLRSVVPKVYGSTTLKTIQYTPDSEQMALHVEGSTYSCNMLIWDYETAAACNIDELYIRRIGATIPANQVLTGSFADGLYTFPGDVVFSNQIYVDTINVKKLISDDSIFNVTTFNDDALFNRDIITNQALRIRGQIYTEVLSNVSIDGTSNYAFQMIQWTPASPSLSNINLMGQGISTPGRMGVGINPKAYNPVNNQFAIYKNDPNIFEIELYDKSSPVFKAKAAYIGHPLVSPKVHGGMDGSLVIATPAANDPDYSGRYGVAPQHIYFFPGLNRISSAVTLPQPYITDLVPPTLGIFNNLVEGVEHRYVGINTYDPRSELDVNGSITFTGDLMYAPPNGQVYKVGLWKESIIADEKPNRNNYFTGVSYIPSASNGAHVGINTLANSSFGLTIEGLTKFNTGIYIADERNIDRKVASWMDNRDALTMLNNVAPSTYDAAGGIFTWAGVGVGVQRPSATMEIKNCYDDVRTSNNGTSFQLTESSGNIKVSTIVYQGITTGDVWRMQTDHTRNPSIFQMGYGPTSFAADSNLRYIWMRPPNPLDYVNPHPQVVIGADLDVFNNPLNPDTNAYLTVGGNISVLGDVNITGQFKMQGLVVVNSNILNNNFPTDQTSDDVYISGGYVQLNPSTGKNVVLGTPFSGLLNQGAGNTRMLTVYDENVLNNSGIIASFQTRNNNALIELKNNRNNTLLFGAVDPTSSTYNRCPFIFMDDRNNTYMSFVQAVSSATDYYVGFGVPTGQIPTAKQHIYTNGNGEHMLCLTKGVFGEDSTDDAPQIDLQKIYQYTNNPNSIEVVSQAATTWSMKGAVATWNQKLSFLFSEAVATGSSASTQVEPFCITPQGCVGIGNTKPEFSLDIINTNNIGGIRIRDTGDFPAPHLMFQSGDPTYGADELIDYRMAASNNTFMFESYDSKYGLRTIMNVSSSNSVGIRGPYTSNYDITLWGTVNVTGVFYIGGSTIKDILSSSIDIEALNVFLSPKRFVDGVGQVYQGGVVVNNKYLENGTGNIFYIYSGNATNPISSANMLVLDSTLNQSQLHFRAQEVDSTGTLDGIYNMYRIGMSNQTFFWNYFPNSGNDPYVPDNSNGYSNVMSVTPYTPEGSYYPSRFDFTVMGNLISASPTTPTFVLGNIGAVGASNGIIYMGPQNGSSNTALVVNQAGNVGIGTSVPNDNYNLTVQGTAGVLGTIELNNTTLNTNSAGYLSITSNSDYIGVVAKDVVIGTSLSNQIDIQVGDTSIPGVPGTSNIQFLINNNIYQPILSDSNNTVTVGQLPFSIIENATNGGSCAYPAMFNVYASNLSGSGSGSGSSMTGLIVNQCSTPYGNERSNDVARFMANSTPVMIVKQTGNVSIGEQLQCWQSCNAALLTVSASNSTFNTSNNIASFVTARNGEQVTINSEGLVGIGTTLPEYNLHVDGKIYASRMSTFGSDLEILANLYVDGNSYVDGNEITGLLTANTSDRRLKKDIQKITNALDKVKSISGYTFDRIEEKYNNQKFTGLIAQEVQEVLPEVILEYEGEDKNKYLSIAYGNMMGLIVEAIKELSDQVQVLSEKVNGAY